MGDFYDLAQRRGTDVRRLEAALAELRERFAELEQAVDDRDMMLMQVRDELAAAERTIDDLRSATWRPHR